MIPARDAAELEWYLGIGMTRFVRSTTGGLLERASLYCYDSNGKRVPYVTDSWSVMMPKHVKEEPSYMPDDRDLDRFARVSRRLLALSRVDNTSYCVLCAYHGDSGARWGREKAGRIASIFPMTKTGKAIQKALRGKYTTSIELRDDELIATEIGLQEQQPNDIRRVRLARMRMEAEELLVRAAKNWRRAA